MQEELAVELIDEAIAAIDRYHEAYGAASEANSMATRFIEGRGQPSLWDRARDVEHQEVLPTLDGARQIVDSQGISDLDLTEQPNNSSYNQHPYMAHRERLVILRARIRGADRISRILEPAGPSLATESLHSTIWSAASGLFGDGHYAAAVQTAATALEGRLQGHSGWHLSGADLAQLFAASGGKANKILHFDFLDPDSDTYSSAREGAGFLIRGAMMGVRNLVSHPGWPEPDEVEALEMLAVLSYVARLIDRAVEL